VQELTGMTDISVLAPVPPIVHLDALPVGTRLGEFEVQSLLGVGGFGMVYRAYDHSLHRTVAIKEYMPAALVSRQNGLAVSIRSSADLATYESGLKSFVGEARLLAQFDHPSLVKVYRFWEANNTAYMVMPLYSGMTLKQARNQMVAPPSEAWLRTVLWSILQALQVLHKHNTLHRDVSPDNIFLQDMGPPVLLDLGAARRAISDRSHKLTAILKVNYAPIEQYAEVDDLHQGPWTDLYSLAAVVYTCLRNDPPMPATSRVVRDNLLPLASVAKTVQEHFRQAYTDEFVSTITHALAIQPADRPQSVQSFVDEMRLEAVKDLAKFDWRANLGGPLRPAGDDSARSDATTQSRTIPAQTIPAPTIPAEPEDSLWPDTTLDVTALPSPDMVKLVRKSGRSRSRAWLVAAIAMALFAGVGLWLFLGTDLLDDGLLVAAPEPAVVPIAVPAEPVASEPVAVIPPVDPGPPTVVHEPVAGPVPVHPVTTAATEATPTPAAPKKQRAAAREKADSAPRPVQKPAPALAKTEPPVARELCTDANFLLRPMCIHLECQKAQNARLPVCIEDRKRYPSGSGSTGP
jgi:serine/threonine protein kinase